MVVFIIMYSMSCMHVTLVLNKKFDSIDGHVHVSGCIGQLDPCPLSRLVLQWRERSSSGQTTARVVIQTVVYLL